MEGRILVCLIVPPSFDAFSYISRVDVATGRAFINQTSINRILPMTRKYFNAIGGHPGQDKLLTDRAIFTEAYAFLPKGTMRDIVASYLPFWSKTRLWVIARPMSGFAETFSQYIMEVQPGGGSERPEIDIEAQSVLFIVAGTAKLSIGTDVHQLTPGGYAYLPPGQNWALHNDGSEPLRFHWIRKAYDAVKGLDLPEGPCRKFFRLTRC